MAVWVNAWYGHEGFGYNGGQGHESLGRAAAAEPQNDPRAAIEYLVRADSAKLDEDVFDIVRAIAVRITNAAADSTVGIDYIKPSGNQPSAPIWFWRPGSSAFVNVTLGKF